MNPAKADAKPNELRILRELEGLISTTIHEWRDDLQQTYRLPLSTIHAIEVATNIHNHFMNAFQ